MKQLGRIYIGYDPREDIAARVCDYSIKQHWPLADTKFLALSDPDVAAVYKRTFTTEHGHKIDDIDRKPFSTDFAFSRFLVPHLRDYEGWALFCDCDFLFLDDPRKLMEYADDEYAVCCVRHNHRPRETEKMDGAVQTVYERKNWSSLVLWNCGHPENRRLTPHVVNTHAGHFLHQFRWLHARRIAGIPEAWNWLADVSPTFEAGGTPPGPPRAIHYTLGGPWLPGYENCQFADQWNDHLARYRGKRPREAA